MFNGQFGMLGGSMLPNQSMNRSMNPMMMQQFQQQTPNNEEDPRFKPPKTLRDLLDELIEEQQECLVLASNRLAGLRNVAQQGRNAAGKGPGDEYISAERLGSVKQGATLTPSAEQRSSPVYSRRRWPSHLSSTSIQPSTKEGDPLSRYQELDAEVLALVGMSMSQEWQGNPMQALHDRWTAQTAGMINPKKVADDRLAKLLGPADGSGKMPDAPSALQVGAMVGGAGGQPTTPAGQVVGPIPVGQQYFDPQYMAQF